MAKKIVVAVMVIDDEVPDAKPDYYQNVAINADADTLGAIQQTQVWISEQLICAKQKARGF